MIHGDAGGYKKRSKVRKGLTFSWHPVKISKISILDSAETRQEQVGTCGPEINHGFEINE
jgi:hypothetical protein